MIQLLPRNENPQLEKIDKTVLYKDKRFNLESQVLIKKC